MEIIIAIGVNLACMFIGYQIAHLMKLRSINSELKQSIYALQQADELLIQIDELIEQKRKEI